MKNWVNFYEMEWFIALSAFLVIWGVLIITFRILNRFKIGEISIYIFRSNTPTKVIAGLAYMGMGVLGFIFIWIIVTGSVVTDIESGQTLLTFTLMRWCMTGKQFLFLYLPTLAIGMLGSTGSITIFESNIKP